LNIQDIPGHKVDTSTIFRGDHYTLKIKSNLFCLFSLLKEFWTFEVVDRNKQKKQVLLFYRFD